MARDWWNSPRVGDVEKAERLLDAHDGPCCESCQQDRDAGFYEFDVCCCKASGEG